MTTPPTGPSSTPLLRPTSSSPTSPVSTWRVGQVLNATVVSAPQAGTTELRIGSLQVRAQTGALALSAGQTLRLEVASLKTLPVLRLLNLLQSDPINQAMRSTLPRQQPITPLLASLTRLARDSNAAAALTPEAARLARELFAKLPTTAAVTQANGLRQALHDSGLFLEPKLAHADASKTADMGRDFKANLLRLVQVLRNQEATRPAGAAASNLTQAQVTAGNSNAAASAAGLLAQRLAAALASSELKTAAIPPLQRGQAPLPQSAQAQPQLALLSQQALQRQVEGALARVQLNQLSSLNSEPKALTQEWLIELPVRRDTEIDLWALRIQRDQQHESARQSPQGGAWSVMLAFDLPGLGPLQARVSLRGEQVSAQFFSQSANRLPVLGEYLPVLHARLQAVGLVVADITLHHGQIPNPSQPAHPPILDEHV